MNGIRKLLAPAAAVAAALLLAGSAAADTVTKSFDVAPGGRLTVDTDLGSIEVRAAGEGRVEVEVIREGSDAQDLKLDFSQSGDDVTIRGDYPRQHGWFHWTDRLKVRFRITVPSRYDVDLKTSGGSISVDDLEGDVRSATSGGSLHYGNIRGPVWGRTSGGSIVLRGSAGDADVETSGGSIDLGEVAGRVRAETSGGSIHVDRARGSVYAKTSGGGIRVDEVMGEIEARTSGGTISAYISRQPEAACRLSTSGGGVDVQLAADVAVDVDAAASGGRVSSSFDLSDESKTRSSLRGKLNGGGPELYLRTSGGSVRIHG
jgi:DUF4097 and DUF4098 domain-containing protein YvlB